MVPRGDIRSVGSCQIGAPPASIRRSGYDQAVREGKRRGAGSDENGRTNATRARTPSSASTAWKRNSRPPRPRERTSLASSYDPPLPSTSVETRAQAARASAAGVCSLPASARTRRA